MNDESSRFASAAETAARPQATTTLRAAWMRELALANAVTLDAAMSTLARNHDLPGFRVIRAPETGMTMVRGRSGGSGAPFNLGEMTVTRCALALDGGELGLAYVQGRDHRHAQHAAYADALLQAGAWHAVITKAVIEPLRQVRAEKAAARAADNAASRVDFFTLARGDADDIQDDDDERQPPSENPEHESHVD